MGDGLLRDINPCDLRRKLPKIVTAKTFTAGDIKHMFACDQILERCIAMHMLKIDVPGNFGCVTLARKSQMSILRWLGHCVSNRIFCIGTPTSPVLIELA